MRVISLNVTTMVKSSIISCMDIQLMMLGHTALTQKFINAYRNSFKKSEVKRPKLKCGITINRYRSFRCSNIV